MNNPWKSIELSDYENHMGLDNVRQLQALNAMMREQFFSYRVKSVMILGVAGGNGLEHIKIGDFERVYGVDINQEYLAECERRFPSLSGVLETICADLLGDNLTLPHSELLIADLLLEYIGYECFKKVVELVNPKYVSCVIQINTDNSFVSDSPYLHKFDRLDEVHCQIDPKELNKVMLEIGYAQESQTKTDLPNGKKLIKTDYRFNNRKGFINV
ncbi:MAG: class I SAM-dependent methyltransferase [Oscillospiraceae bacterium]|nr:class I SAM-dependent methyltransferase [Oscillospiraceae bacterium]